MKLSSLLMRASVIGLSMAMVVFSLLPPISRANIDNKKVNDNFDDKGTITNAPAATATTATTLDKTVSPADSVLVPTTFTYSGPVVGIPDGLGAESPGATVIASLVVSGLTGTITDVNFRFLGSVCNTTTGSTTVGLDHSFAGDLNIVLQSPLGTQVTIINRLSNGGGGNSGNNFCQTALDDGTANPSVQTLLAASAPFTGTFKPANVLSTFNGENPNGIWQLRVTDFFVGDTGNIRTFSLEIDSAVAGIARKKLDFDGHDPADYAVITSGGTLSESLTPKSPKNRIQAGIPRPMSPGANGGGPPTNWDILSNFAGPTSVTFGQIGDFFVPGQFTSDNRADIAIWRPSTQQFIICNSNASDIFVDPTPCTEVGEVITTPAIGDAASDPTVTGDYTGDGIDDPCVFTGTQWIYLPNNGDGTFGAAVTVSFGQLGDFPSPGDYNNDGMYDFGVSRPDAGNPSNAHFFLDYNGVTPGVSDADGVFRESDDVIVPGDYDGDGQTEIAIADVTTFPYIHWVYASSLTGVIVGHAWGDNSIGFQAQADYDGDPQNTDDIAVWHSDPTGTFFVRRSSDLGLQVQSWGLSSDYPVAYYQSH
jgi:subtilisin-like proprotein convertase family protein